ncbi:MAG: GGDEF domain-containing protein [Vibrio sp.]|uniref:GGDEF domain-containing protein n=1 Tax=Vibrio sp. TaxID=678 RepID=UPI003A856FCE
MKNFANLINKHTRNSDFISRFGGEEFMIVATNTDANSAFLLANKLREKVEKEVVKINDDKELKYTISCGVACLTPNLTLADLYKNADSALYEAKSSGRNNVKIYIM